tara:strand:- start:55 stop:249 length:195 start_codon:yes stop_codon:yes gene_type:complete
MRLHERFVGEKRPRLMPSRRLLREGKLVKIASSGTGWRQRIYLYLFNDLLVYADDGALTVIWRS